MKTLLIAAVILWPAPLMAFEAGAAIEILDSKLSACMEDFDHDGGTVTLKDSREACREVVQTLYELSKNGYCFDEAGNEWKRCKN